jgi:hypothetical protein
VKSFLIATGAAALSAALAAQTPSPAAAPPTHLNAAGQMQSQYNIVKSNLTKLADKMPDDAYAYKPVNETRTFAQGVAHTAATNFAMCANLTGKTNPKAGVDLEKTITTKPDASRCFASRSRSATST